MAGFGKLFENLVRIVDRRWHEIWGFTAGIAEHDALISCTFFALTIRCVVHALRDVGGLWMQKHIDFHRTPVKAVLLVTDFTDRLSRCRAETGRINQRMPRRVVRDGAVLILLQESLRHAYFASDDHAIGGGKRFTCNANRPRIDAGAARLLVNHVYDFIGNTVANLVWMTFRHGFAGEEIRTARHG